MKFDRMHVWMRILDLPFEWMNKIKGEQIAGMVCLVERVDVDEFGDAASPFLRASR